MGCDSSSHTEQMGTASVHEMGEKRGNYLPICLPEELLRPQRRRDGWQPRSRSLARSGPALRRPRV